MATSRPPVPEPIKREVRQRCGFGCVVCGMPLYDYEHMEDFSRELRHDPENITLLCPNHHAEKTRGAMPAEVVRAHNRKPKNVGQQATSPRIIHYFGDSATLIIGGNAVHVSQQSISALMVDGHSLVGFELDEGHLLLNLDLRDGDGVRLLRVDRNELVHSISHWDYEFVGQRLRIRNAPRDIALEVRFDPRRGTVVIEKGLLSHNGVEVWATPEGICVLNNRCVISGSSFQGMNAAISIGDLPDEKGLVGIQMALDRGEFDRQAAIEWAEVQLAAIRPGVTSPWLQGREYPADATPQVRSIAWWVCMKN